MNAQQYQAWSEPLRRNPDLLRVLTVGNKALTYLGYFMYPLLLAWVFMAGSPDLIRYVLVPGISFVLVSVFRKLFNFPRPYEVLDIDPLIVKDTQGKSFPSRHTFSMFMIAFCWLHWMPLIGALLVIAGIALASVRVLGGVHFPRDVIAGAAIAFICGIIGFWPV